jgi:fatty acid desaturase
LQHAGSPVWVEKANSKMCLQGSSQAFDVKKVQCLDEIKNSDLVAERNEYLFRTPFLVDYMSGLLKDQRDLPMLCLLLNIIEVLAMLVPVVYGINIWQPQLSLLTRNAVGLVYLVSVIVLFQERFTLCIHYVSHRSIFRSDTLNHLITHVIAPFFGIPPGVYKLHHCIMHHIENNHSMDGTSTEAYQRDSLTGFLKYWANFSLGIYYNLFSYCIATKRWNHLVHMVVCCWVSWTGGILVLAKYVNPVATMWVFVIPHVFAMSAMAFGNWSQHIFIDPKDSRNNFGLTYNCMDTPGNQTTFNDGYHIIHHYNTRLHWTEIPAYFHESREKHFKNNALTFRGLHFFDVGFLVMTGQLKKLVEKHYIYLGPKETAPSIDTVMDDLQARLKPLPTQPAETKAKTS